MLDLDVRTMYENTVMGEVGVQRCAGKRKVRKKGLSDLSDWYLLVRMSKVLSLKINL